MANPTPNEMPIGRPDSYDKLLAHAISDNGKGESYSGWEQDHAGQRSFYVGGIRTFLLDSGIDDHKRLLPYGGEAVKLVKKETNWTDMPSSAKQWDQCGLPQFVFAREAQPTFFQKCALVIVSCELALRDRIAQNKPLRKKGMQPEDIYGYMNIIPACWSIEEFDEPAFRDLNSMYPGADNEIKAHASQRARTFLKHLSTGYTTTFATAEASRAYMADKCPKVRVGALSASPNRPLGINGATTFEKVDTK